MKIGDAAAELTLMVPHDCSHSTNRCGVVLFFGRGSVSVCSMPDSCIFAPTAQRPIAEAAVFHDWFGCFVHVRGTIQAIPSGFDFMNTEHRLLR